MSTLPKTEWIIKNSIEIYGKLEITINVLRDEHFNKNLTTHQNNHNFNIFLFYALRK